MLKIDAVADFQHQINTTPLAVSAPRSGSCTRSLMGQKTPRSRGGKTTGFKVDAVYSLKSLHYKL